MLYDKVQKPTATSLELPYVHIHKNKKFQLVHIFSSVLRHPLHRAGLDRRERAPRCPRGCWSYDVLELEGAALGDPAGSRETCLPTGWSPELREAPVLELDTAINVLSSRLFPLDLSRIGVREKNKIQTNSNTKPRNPNNHQGRSEA